MARMLRVLLLVYHAIAVVAAGAATCDFRAHHPRRYAVHHLQRSSSPPDSDSRSLRQHRHNAITIDGVLDETAWEEVPWSEDFVDIQGPRHWSQPWFATRVKLRYDDTFLYVGAYLEESLVWANVTARNAVVFMDNDFEIFVDAGGTTHNYKELEINALNTTWNLWLNRPYRDGGHENSTRVDPTYGFDMARSGLETAVYMKGTPHRATGDTTQQQLHFWTVELALPLVALAQHTTAVVPPLPYSYWRINFSRVEWAVETTQDAQIVKIPGQREDNWVWNPQFAIDMHRPEHWGYIQFLPPVSDDAITAQVPMDPEWSVRFIAFELYYAQHACRDATGAFASSMDALVPFLASAATRACLVVQDFGVKGPTFTASVMVRGAADFVAHIQDDSLIHVTRVAAIEAMSIA